MRRWAASRRRICTAAASASASERSLFPSRPCDGMVKRRSTSLEQLEADAWGCVFFDRLLATALLHFGEEACPPLVLEAGVGGVHDSTNFFTEEELELAVITSISLDHTALLGDTLTEIATNKAGVMRPKTKAVTPSTQPVEALDALQREADRVGAELVVVDCSGTVKNRRQREKTASSQQRPALSKCGGRLFIQ